MNTTRFFLGIVVGALSMGAMLAAAGYLISLYVPSGGGGFISNPEILVAIYGAIFGAVVGGVSGAIIVGFELSFFKAVLFGFFLNTFISVFWVFWADDDPFYNNYTRYLLISLIISGTINGAIVSLINDGQKSPPVNLKNFHKTDDQHFV